MMTNQQKTLEPPPVDNLLELIAEFLKDDVAPLITDDKVKFRLRVAENLLHIIRRELANVDDLRIDRDGYLVPEEIIETAGSLKELANGLYTGTYDLTDPDIFALMERYVTLKLNIVAPSFAGKTPD